MIQWIQNKKIKYEIIQCRYYNDCIKFMVEVVKQKKNNQIKKGLVYKCRWLSATYFPL